MPQFGQPQGENLPVRQYRPPAFLKEGLDHATILGIYESCGGLRRGHFLLSSGKHSDTYLQSALVLQWPWVAEALGRTLSASWQGQVDAVLAPALGGLVIGHEVARALEVRLLFAERAQGAMTLRRGFQVDHGERVLVVEDVVTTGASSLEVCRLVVGAGATVVAMAAIVDRRPPSVQLPIPLASLVRVAAAAWEPNDCPACQSGSEPESPGSRHLLWGTGNSGGLKTT